MRSQVMSRTATVIAVAGMAVAGLAAPAYAHVEVTADKAQAGATDVTLTFVGEAESDKAGIRSERFVLPQGIAPADVTLAKAPTGWTLVPTVDGVTVGGKALPIGTDAKVSIKVAQLPADQTRLSFKTLETYGDGTVDRWIEIQKEGAEEPEHPAPLLVVRKAAAVISAAPSSVGPVLTAGPLSQTTPQDKSGNGATLLWLLLGAAVVLVAAGAFYLARRRRA